jgi:ABC-type multidrug transport system permease subunit
MGFLWTTAVKDWRRRLRNPAEFVIWLGIPLVIGLLITLAFGGRAGPRPQARVLVADNDQSVLSRFLIGAMSQDAAAGFVRAEAVGEEEGRRRITRGGATALIVIPQGFSRAVLSEEPTAIALVTNPSERILPGMIEEALGILVDGAFYLHRLAGDDLKFFADGPSDHGGFPDEVIAALGARINRTARRLSGYLSPPLITLETTTDESEAEQPSFAFLLLPSILFMALLFMAQGLSEDFWEERRSRTLRRFVSSPRPVAAFLLGKVLAAAGLFFAVSLVALAAGYVYLGLDVATMPLALIWATASGTMLATVMTAIHLFARSQRAGSILVMTVIFPLMMIGGSFFPFEAMPAWMAAIGKRTPNGWALQQLKGIVLDTARPLEVAASLLLLCAILAFLCWVCAVRMKRSFAQG